VNYFENSSFTFKTHIMLSRTFFRWSAVAVFLGALVLGTGYLLRANIENENIDQFASTQGLLSSIMVAGGSLLFLFGLPGLFASQNLYSSTSGIVASLLSFTGIAAFHLGTLALYFVAPVLVTHSAATRALMYSDEPPFPRFALFWATSLLIQVVGLVWIGLRLLKNGNTVKIASLLLVAGGLVFLSAPFIYFRLIKPANTITMIGFSIIAYSMFRTNRSTERQKKANQIKRRPLVTS
jgi:hypothetical protein